MFSYVCTREVPASQILLRLVAGEKRGGVAYKHNSHQLLKTTPITGGRWSEIEYFLFKTRFASFLQLCEMLFSNSSEFGVWINWSNEQLLKLQDWAGDATRTHFLPTGHVLN